MDTNYTILMAVMGMGIGGAETHVLELARELKRSGFRVIVASNGGVYEKDLAESGVCHYRLPLHNKNPINMLRSYFGLRRIIKEEKVDIVHGHARIPSFLCGLLHKSMKFPFITTAHWIFNTRGMLRYLTNWGQKTIAVSDDIKKYLIDNYSLPEKDITTTINGIDTNKFSSDIDASDVQQEFDLSPGKNRIVYISRMDSDRCLVAFQLVQIAEKLNKSIDNLEIVIVGAGDSFSRLSDMASGVNARVGRPLIKLAGARTDINKFIKTGKIFVGVSRAALEAMAMEKPVIVAGNEGYIGIFDENKLDVCVKTNFTCRTCPQSAPETLFKDILYLINEAGEAELSRLGSYGRQIIMERYSVSRMAQDTIHAYQSLLAEKKILNDVIISGYYGFKNSGDDALLLAIIDNLRMYMPEIKICVLSFRPKETRVRYGACSVNRYNPFSIIRQMKGAKLLISGGGSLIQDATSTQSLLYYLFIIKLAKLKGLKTMLYANGIGPVNKKRNRRRAADVLKRIDLITLRDPGSMAELEQMGVSRDGVILTADPAFSICCAKDERIKQIMQDEGIPLDSRMAGIAVRRWKMHGPDFEKNIALTCDYIAEKLGLVPVFLNMQYPADLKISLSIASKMKNKPHIVMTDILDTEMLGLISKMEIIIGERLHTLVYAAATGVPLVGIVYDPKVQRFLEYVGQDKYVTIQNLCFETLRQNVEACLNEKNRLKHELEKNAKKMRELSLYNAQLAVKLIKEK